MRLGANALLLDTNALIWLAEGVLAQDAVERVDIARVDDGVLVSPVSAWEVGLLATGRPGRPPRYAFHPNPATWFAAIMAQRGTRPAPFTAEIALLSTQLPEPLHPDPGDRFLIATARVLGVPMMTRDRKILAYAGGGNLQALAC